jgi:hypothetical protein
LQNIGLLITAAMRSSNSAGSTNIRRLINAVHVVTCTPIARQRLGKHIPAKRTRSTEGRPLLGNGEVGEPP